MLYSHTLAKSGKPGPEWKLMEIILGGPRTSVILNRSKVTDSRGLRNQSDEGVVLFKEVAVKKLPKYHPG